MTGPSASGTWPPASPLASLEGHTGAVYGVAVTPDGTRAVSASDDRTLRVWDLATGKSLASLEGHTNAVFGVAVTPDGTRAVSASEDTTLRVWDLATGRSLASLEGHTRAVLGVAVTPDGTRAVSASLGQDPPRLGPGVASQGVLHERQGAVRR